MNLPKLNQRIDSRTFMTVSLIAIVSAFMLMLVTPSIAPYLPFQAAADDSLTNFMFWAVISLFWLVPLAVGLALLVILFGKSDKSKPVRAINAQKITKLLAATTVVAVAGSYMATSISDHITISSGHSYFFWQNVGTAMTFIAAATGLLLVNYQKYVYFPFWNKHDKKSADERQKYVRQRVFEKAYSLNLIASLVVVFLWSNASDRMHQVLVFGLLILLLGLPAVIAAWQKDS